MMWRAPSFWYRPQAGWQAALLSPLAALWQAAGRVRRAKAAPYRAGIPVICVGNVGVGGSGKTPVAIALAQALAAQNPCFLTRGYGGHIRDAARVTSDDATLYGDEAVLLARHAPVIVAPDRVQGLKLAEASGFGCVIADDGFQNPHFGKTASILVFDGAVGIGNGRCIPAGPLRETLADALPRAQAAIIVGDDVTGLASALTGLPVFSARLEAEALPGRYVAFAGIGRPDKFFASLRAGGAELPDTVSFPDHYPYSADDLARLSRAAQRHNAMLVTTEKDFVRIPKSARAGVAVLPVHVVIDEMAALTALVAA